MERVESVGEEDIISRREGGREGGRGEGGRYDPFTFLFCCNVT
jgi:hypothetical protein